MQSSSMDEFVDRYGQHLKFVDGDWIHAGEKPNVWERRRILSMNLLSRNVKKNISEWELHLDCQHDIRETCNFDDSPKDLYRDCQESKH